MSLFLRAKVKGDIFDLDVQEDIPLRLDVSAVENGEIGKTFGVASQTFTLPSSRKNDKFFRAAFNVNSVSARAFYNSVDVSVIQNSNEVFSGKLFLQEVVTDFDGNTNYQVYVGNESVDFTNQIKDQYLAQLDMSEYDHAYSSTVITSSWDGDLLGGDVFYPLAHYGTDDSQDFPEIAAGGTTGKIDFEDTPMLVTQFKPAIRAKALVDKIFESVDYRYSSSFFDSDEFNDMYVLATRDDKLGVAMQSTTDAGFIAGHIGPPLILGNFDVEEPVPFNNEIYDPGLSYNPSTYKFTVGTAGTYAFQIQFKGDSSPDFYDVYKRLGVRLKRTRGASTVVLTNQNFDFLTQQTLTYVMTTAGFPLQSGDEIFVSMIYDAENTNSPPDDLYIYGDLREFRTLYAPQLVINGNVDFAQQFDQKFKSLDFLQGLIEKFNLVVEPDPNDRKQLIIEPFTTWAESGGIKDWTEKVDHTKRVSIAHPITKQPKSIKFSDVKDDDALTKYAAENFDTIDVYGTHEYSTTSDLAQGSKEVGTFFSPLPIKGIDGAPQVIIPQLHKNESGEKKAYKFKPRLGFKVDNRSSAGFNSAKFYLENTVGGDTHEVETFSTIMHLDELPANPNTTNSLHFNATRWYPFHQNYSAGYTPNGAYNNYWAQYIDELYSEEARLLTCDMYFKPSDLTDIRLNDRIWVRDAYYRINKISGFNLTTDDVVKVELLKVPVQKFDRPVVYIDNPVDFGDPVDAETIAVTPTNFDTSSGIVTFSDAVTGEEITGSAQIQQAALYLGYDFLSGSAYWSQQSNGNLRTSQTSNLGGNSVVDSTATNVLGAADSSTIGTNVNRAVIVGQSLSLESDATDAIVSGKNSTVETFATNATILSSDNVSAKSGSDSAFLIGAKNSNVYGTRCGVIGGNRNNIFSRTISSGSVIVASSGSYIYGRNNSVYGGAKAQINRHVTSSVVLGGVYGGFGSGIGAGSKNMVHIGGNNGYSFWQGQEWTTEGINDNAVSIGELPTGNFSMGESPVPILKGQTELGSKVIVGNSVIAGAQYVNITGVTGSAGTSDTIDPSDEAFMYMLHFTGSNGDHDINLFDASTEEGRMLRFKTDSTVNNSKSFTLVPSSSQTIDGGAEFTMDRAYDGITVLAHNNQWWVIQKKEK